jgi:large subunit ribosomal protein L29
MKLQDIRNMTKIELGNQVSSLKDEFSKLMFQKKSGTLEKSARLSQIRKDIARIKTVLREASHAK